MPIPEFIASLRTKIGNDQLLVPTVGVLASDADGRFLLVRDRDSGLWSFPGGIIEPDEVPADAAVRETWEESGVFVEITRVVGIFGGNRCSVVYQNGDRLAWVATIFGARAVSGTPRGDGTETLDARFFHAEQLTTLPLRNGTRMFVDSGVVTASAPYFEPPKWRPDAVPTVGLPA